MTLLEATAHLIDLAKTSGPEDAITRRAIKRMEKRLEVLRLRAAKALRARRHSAWVDFEVVYQGNHPDSKCHKCGFEIGYGDFVKSALLTGRGHIKRFCCPACGQLLIGFPQEGETSRLPSTDAFAEDNFMIEARRLGKMNFMEWGE